MRRRTDIVTLPVFLVVIVLLTINSLVDLGVVVPVHGLASTDPTAVTTYSRRGWFKAGTQKLIGVATLVSVVATTDPKPSKAADTGPSSDQFDPNDPEFQELYDNPAIPPAPEERSGLVVLRVAEVAQFQEKILRAVESGELKGVSVSPMQFAFGTQILLRNSGLDSNMKLMISEEIPRSKRPLAAKNAANVMNKLQDIAKFANSIQRDFKKEEMVQLADMYLEVRVNLNQLYEYLPEKEKDKYYGYFVAVTDYEKKIAEGVYNPDIDGILKLEY